MPKPKPTWNEKLHSGKAPEVKRLAKPFAGMREGDLMLIASPAVIEEYVKNIPRGRTASVKAMREELASQHGAEFTCPTSTGIFLRVVAEAAWERHLAGESLDIITPFWRVLDSDSPLASKLACGADFIAEQRGQEAVSGAKKDGAPNGNGGGGPDDL